MAYLADSSIQFVGKIKGNLSTYKRRDSDKIFVRTKGGPSKKQIKTLDSCENVRQINAEFGGRSTSARRLRTILYALQHTADRNLLSGLNSLLRPIQKSDASSDIGKRHVLLSNNPQLLEGFSLNKKNSLESIILSPISAEIFKDTLSATVNIPQLIPRYNFSKPGDYPWYQITAVLGVMPDMLYDAKGYQPVSGFRDIHPGSVSTIWFPVRKGSPACELNLSLSPGDLSSASLVLAVGVSFGRVKDENEIELVKGRGAGKIMRVLK